MISAGNLTKQKTPQRSQTLVIVLCALATLLVTSSAFANETAVGVRFPVEFRSWKLEDQSGNENQLSQLYAPVIVTLSFSPQTDLIVSTSGGSTELDLVRTKTTTVSGLTDLKAEVYQRFGHNRFVAIAGVNVPSGQTELSFDELVAMKQTNHPVLGMQLRQYGQGLDFNLGLGWSAPLGPQAKLAFAAGVVVPGSYTIQSGDEEFSPTTQLSFSGGIDIRNARWAKRKRSASLQATLRLFSKDQLGDNDAFEEGDQINLQFRTRAEVGVFKTSLNLATTLKNDNATLTPDGETVAVLKSVAGTGILVRGSIRYADGARFQPGLELDWRRFGDADDVSRNGTALGVGPSLGMGVGTANWLQVQALYLVGNSGEGRAEFDLSGIAVSASYVWRVVQ